MTERKLKTWTIEETRSVLLQIKKKILQLDTQITIPIWNKNHRDEEDKKDEINFDIDTIKDRFGDTKKYIRNGQFEFKKQSAVAPDGYSTTSERIDVVPIRGGYNSDYGFLSIKLSIGHTRDDYRKDSIEKKLEKRVTPRNIERLDEILNELVTEFQRRYKIRSERHLIDVKERQSEAKLSKTFPDFAEKIGFGKKETHTTITESIWGEGNYLNIEKEFNGTEIELQQRSDGDFNLRLVKLNATKVKELMERLK